MVMRTGAGVVSRPSVARCAPVLRPRRAVVVVRAFSVPAPVAGKPIEKLKRAPTAFNLYYKAAFAKVKADLLAKGQQGTLAECAKILRQQWEALSETHKQPYTKQAASIKEQFEAAKAAGRIPGKEPKPADPAGPKPLAVYAAFTKAQFPAFKKQYPTKTAADIAKLIAEQWKALDPTKKAALKATYDKEIEAYRARQAALGITPAVRRAAPATASPKQAAKAPAVAAAQAAPKAAATAPPPATKRASPTPVQQAPVAPKAAVSPARGATPTKRVSPAKH